MYISHELTDTSIAQSIEKVKIPNETKNKSNKRMDIPNTTKDISNKAITISHKTLQHHLEIKLPLLGKLIEVFQSQHNIAAHKKSPYIATIMYGADVLHPAQQLLDAQYRENSGYSFHEIRELAVSGADLGNTCFDAYSRNSMRSKSRTGSIPIKNEKSILKIKANSSRLTWTDS
jgi:hypothetical protein